MTKKEERLVFKLDKKLKDQIKQVAEEEDIPMSIWLRREIKKIINK